MFSFLGIAVAVAAVAFSVYRSVLSVQGTKTLALGVGFVRFANSQIRYNSLPSEVIFEKAKNTGYGSLMVDENGFSLPENCGSEAVDEFSNFINNLGTSDRESQLEMCEMQIKRLNELLDARIKKERESIRLRTALSVLTAVAALVLL